MHKLSCINQHLLAQSEAWGKNLMQITVKMLMSCPSGKNLFGITSPPCFINVSLPFTYIFLIILVKNNAVWLHFGLHMFPYSEAECKYA